MFFVSTMVMVTVALVMAVIVTNIYAKKESPERCPRWCIRIALHFYSSIHLPDETPCSAPAAATSGQPQSQQPQPQYQQPAPSRRQDADSRAKKRKRKFDGGGGGGGQIAETTTVVGVCPHHGPIPARPGYLAGTAPGTGGPTSIFPDWENEIVASDLQRPQSSAARKRQGPLLCCCIGSSSVAETTGVEGGGGGEQAGGGGNDADFKEFSFGRNVKPEENIAYVISPSQPLDPAAHFAMQQQRSATLGRITRQHHLQHHSPGWALDATSGGTPSAGPGTAAMRVRRRETRAPLSRQASTTSTTAAAAAGAAGLLDYERSEAEWRLVAKLVDRIFFWIFLGLSTITHCAMFMQMSPETRDVLGL